jgi:AcrR family transcriptional regulator
VATRDRILQAAQSVILARGLVRATTREIARAALVSEGTLYNYFASKEELFLAALGQLPSRFISLIVGLPRRAGTETVRTILYEVASAGLDFYREAIPMGASIFADLDLLARHRELLASRGAGPQRANEAVAAYLRGEQDLGRVASGADPEAISYLLLGALYQRAYWEQFLGEPCSPEADEQFIERLLDMLQCALSPLPSA